MNAERIAFSAVIVTCDEAHLLPRCLASVDFCDELIVVDLGSTDATLEVAREHGARILEQPRAPYPNLARQFGITQASHTWVVSIDPDEVFPKHELHKIETIIRDNPDVVGVRLPWQYYFRGRRVRGSVWGRRATKCVVVDRERCEGTPFVHKEFRADQPIYVCSWDEIDPLEHYWIERVSELGRLLRYARCEGESKYAEGLRFSWARFTKYVAAALQKNMIRHGGLLRGPTAFFLSLVNTVYVAISWLSLRRYERTVARSHAGGSAARAKEAEPVDPPTLG